MYDIYLLKKKKRSIYDIYVYENPIHMLTVYGCAFILKPSFSLPRVHVWFKKKKKIDR